MFHCLAKLISLCIPREKLTIHDISKTIEPCFKIKQQQCHELQLFQLERWWLLSCVFSVDFHFNNSKILYICSVLSRWKKRRPLPQARDGHVAVVYGNRINLFCGGDGNKWYTDSWIYDFGTLSVLHHHHFEHVHFIVK